MSFESAEAARSVPRGDIELGICEECSMVHNITFDPGVVMYDRSYENSLHFSARFSAYAAKTANRILGLHGESDLDILEVGCGKGEFLRLLHRDGANRCLGFDASFEGSSRGADADPSFVVRRDPFVSSEHEGSADLVVNRHVLEHVRSPVEFVRGLAQALRRSAPATLFVEVPNGLWTLRDLGVWDLIYEHCSYFTVPALLRVVREAGLIPRSARTEFGDQFLCLEAGVSANGSETVRDSPSVPEILAMADRFGVELATKVARWNDTVDEILAASRRVAVWGAGSKGVTFLNLLRRGRDVQGVIDVNPRKTGSFVAGTGQQIQSPDQIEECSFDVVLIMNPIYEAEIRDRLAAVGPLPEILTV